MPSLNSRARGLSPYCVTLTCGCPCDKALVFLFVLAFDRRSPSLLLASLGKGGREREAATTCASLGNCFDLDLNVYCVLDLHLLLVRSIPISFFIGFNFSDLMPFMHLFCGSLFFFFLFIGSNGVKLCGFCFAFRSLGRDGAHVHEAFQPALC